MKRIALLLLLPSVLACGDSPAEPDADVAPPPPPATTAVAVILTDPWLQGLLDVEDPSLASALRSSAGSDGVLATLVDGRLADRQSLHPDDEIALSILQLEILAARDFPAAYEAAR